MNRMSHRPRGRHGSLRSTTQTPQPGDATSAAAATFLSSLTCDPSARSLDKNPSAECTPEPDQDEASTSQSREQPR